MSVDIEKARNALHEIENSWQKIIDEINQDKNRQIPKEEGNRIRLHGKDQLEQFIRLFTYELDANRDLGLDFTSTSSKIFTHLDIALLEGKRRYETEIHRRNIESITAWGMFFKNLGINFGILISGILGTFLTIKFSGFCP